MQPNMNQAYTEYKSTSKSIFFTILQFFLTLRKNDMVACTLVR